MKRLSQREKKVEMQQFGGDNSNFNVRFIIYSLDKVLRQILCTALNIIPFHMGAVKLNSCKVKIQILLRCEGKTKIDGIPVMYENESHCTSYNRANNLRSPKRMFQILPINYLPMA